MERIETFEIANPHIEINNVSGKVELKTHDAASVIVTVETITANSRDLVEATEIAARGNSIEIIVPNSFGFRNRKVLVSVTTPVSTTVNISTVSADIESTGAIEEIVVKTVSGDIRLDTILNVMELKTTSGDVAVTHSPASSTVTCVSGDVRLNGCSGQTYIKTVSGDCLTHLISGGELNIKSVSGDVTVLVDPEMEIDVTAQSVSGKLTSDIDLNAAGPASQKAVLNMQLKTVSGDVRIRRSAMAE
ncbi:MAG TPA: DUF4097 family beta strand repeat-containing protein [Candidatus Nanopelagicaceae bacterium]|nr:DUF4097 family beta strand repeat-containing protein [Candidatus Nanopelagicaceae bacterium]